MNVAPDGSDPAPEHWTVRFLERRPAVGGGLMMVVGLGLCGWTSTQQPAPERSPVDFLTGVIVNVVNAIGSTLILAGGWFLVVAYRRRRKRRRHSEG